ncbi:MAG: ComEC/Rec2 family competence protein [Actinomycetes bacterium]
MTVRAEPTDPARSGLDLRLLPPVVALWVSAWFTPLIGVPGAATVVTLVAVSVGVILRRSASARSRARRRLATGVLLMLAAGCTTSAVRLAALAAGPWRTLAEQGSTARLVGAVTGDPRAGHAGWGGQPSYSVSVRVEEVASGVSRWQVRSPVVVVGSGPGWGGLSPGQTIELSGRVRSLPGTSGLSALVFARGPPSVVAGAGAVGRSAERIRSGLRKASAQLSPDVSGLLPALVVGDTTAMPEGLVDDLRAAGLSHLTAVSGANVAIVLVAALGLARWLGVRGLALPAVGMLALAAFVVVARPQPSVLRAAVMGAVAVVGVLSAGGRHGSRALLVACGGLLLTDPWLARSWGFALSVAATGGLLWLAPRLRRSWRRVLPPVAADALAVAVAAQLATLPLQLALSGSVGSVGVLANLLAAPAVAPATLFGATAAVVSVVSTPVASVAAWLAGWPVWWIVAVARWSSAAPLPVVRVSPGPRGLVCAAAVTALAVAGGLRVASMPRWRTADRAMRVAVALVLGLALVGWWQRSGRWPPPGWLMVACDVGQGDGLVLNAGGGSAVVVDAGPEPGAIDRCLRRLRVTAVPVVVLTHFHADHVDGLPGVLRDRDVGQIVVSPLAEPPEQAAQVASWARAAGVGLRTVAVGERADVGPLHWQVLWPQRLIRGEGSDPNNASAVLLVEVSGIRLLLTGDVETAAQQAILASGVDLRCDVLKVAHHGSAAQDPAFWQAADPRLAVVSVGADNDYGHPNPELMAAMADAGVMVRRTDQDGDIAVLVDHGGLRIQTR